LVESTEQALGGYLETGNSDIYGLGCGAGIGDLDGDGRLDLVFARAWQRPGGPSQLFFNRGEPGKLRFDKSVVFPDLAQGSDASGVALGDYDRDGDLDVFLARSGPDLLLENDGRAAFQDVTAARGLTGPVDDFSNTAIWVDINNDGLLDLFIGNFADMEEEILNDLPLTNRSVNRLYLNEDGRFRDVTDEANLVVGGATHAVAAADVDEDGSLEIYVGNDYDATRYNYELPRDQLWRCAIGGDGIPSCTDVGEATHFSLLRATMGYDFFDLDDDGKLEVYASDFGANDLLFYDPNSDTFSESASRWGLEIESTDQGHIAVAWSVVALDLNRDELWEMLVINGNLPGGPAQHSMYLEQSGQNEKFGRVQADAGLTAIADPDQMRNARGAYRGDLDADGDDDFVIGVNGGAFQIFDNWTTLEGSLLRVRLRGTVSAPDPGGAKLTLGFVDGGRRIAQRVIGGQPYGHGDAIIDLRMGQRLPAELSVRWPSGFRQIVPSSHLSETIEVVEPAWLTLDRRRVPAGEKSVLTYVAFDELGAAIGAPASGKLVEILRSDAMPVSVTDRGDGSYTAELAHPGMPGTVSLVVSVDGTPYAIRPLLFFD
jgi:hypothetical protein